MTTPFESLDCPCPKLFEGYCDDCPYRVDAVIVPHPDAPDYANGEVGDYA